LAFARGGQIQMQNRGVECVENQKMFDENLGNKEPNQLAQQVYCGPTQAHVIVIELWYENIVRGDRGGYAVYA